MDLDHSDISEAIPDNGPALQGRLVAVTPDGKFKTLVMGPRKGLLHAMPRLPRARGVTSVFSTPPLRLILKVSLPDNGGVVIPYNLS